MKIVDNEQDVLTSWFFSSNIEIDEPYQSHLFELISNKVKQYTTINSDEVVSQMKQIFDNFINEQTFSTPITSVRYSNNANSEELLPGLIAHILRDLYGTIKFRNDINSDTINMELEMGKSIAQMLGFNTDLERHPCAWGHITSGKNTANYNSLWNARAVSCYPLALKLTTKQFDIALKVNPNSNKLITDYSSWECQNFSVDEVINLESYIRKQLTIKNDVKTENQFFNQLHINRIEQMGMASFFAEHWDAKQPLILVSATNYGEWELILKQLGFGSNHLIKLDVNKQMTLDIDSLERVLVNAESKKIPILSVIGILGTAEFGSIDNIAEIILLRDRFKEKGLHFYFHVDASWGGYFCSLLRNADGTSISFTTLRKEFKCFPSQRTYNALEAVKGADSVTVSPYRMGYMAMGTDVLINRNRYLTNIILDQRCSDEETCKIVKQHNKHLCQHILKEILPHTSIIASYTTQKILPLNNQFLGQIIKESIVATEYLYERIKSTIEELQHLVNIILPMEPDGNIFCLTLNPINNHCLTRMNRFTNRVYEQLKSKQEMEGQNRTFFCSIASLEHSSISVDGSMELLSSLGIKQNSFVLNIKDAKYQSSTIKLLRHNMLNPWLLKKIKGKNAIDRYCEVFAEIVQKVSKKESSTMLITIAGSG